MLFRRELDRSQLRALFALKVKPEQEDQVAPNAVTIAQAAYEPGGFVWGLWEGDKPVGLLAMIDPAENPDGGEEAADAAYVWRLMVAADFQGKGFGKNALAEALEVAGEWERPRVLLSAVEKDGGALGFYERFGFERTGVISHGEVEMSVPVEVLRARLKD